MINNVTTIVEMVLLNGNSTAYQQMKQLLDEDGLELLAKVRRKLYIKNHRKNIKDGKFLTSITSASASDEEEATTPQIDEPYPEDKLHQSSVSFDEPIDTDGKPLVKEASTTSDDKSSDSNTIHEATEFFNIGDEAQPEGSSSSYKSGIAEMLVIFKNANDTIKYLEFSAYLNNILEADTAAEYLRVHGETMTDEDAAEYAVIIQQGINTQDVVDKYLREAKREFKQQRKHNKKHRNRGK